MIRFWLILVVATFWGGGCSENSASKSDAAVGESAQGMDLVVGTDEVAVQLVGMDGQGKFELLTEMPAGGYDEIRGWFRLKATSPAINASVESEEILDHWGDNRDNQPDVGAHEY